MVKFKDFSRPLSVYQVLFKANFIFQGPYKTVLYIQVLSSLCEPRFQLCWDGCTWVQPVLSMDKGVLLNDIMRSLREGGRGDSHFFFIRRLGPSIYCLLSINISNNKHPKKIFEYLQPQKNIPILYIYLKKRP